MLAGWRSVVEKCEALGIEHVMVEGNGSPSMKSLEEAEEEAEEEEDKEGEENGFQDDPDGERFSHYYAAMRRVAAMPTTSHEVYGSDD